MRSYTLWALQELLDGFEFERLASEVMINIGYQQIEVRGGFRDGGADAVIMRRGRGQAGEEVRSAYSIQKDWKRKLSTDFKAVPSPYNLPLFVFCTVQVICGNDKDKLADQYKKEYGVDLVIYDATQLVLWLENANWGQHLKARYGLVSLDVAPQSRTFEDLLFRKALLSEDQAIAFVQTYCKKMSSEAPYASWMDSFLMRHIRSSDLLAKTATTVGNTVLDFIKSRASHLLVGEAGAGKTAVLEFLAYHHASSAEEKAEPILPIYICLSEIGRCTLFDLIYQTLFQFLPGLRHEQATAMIHSTHTLFLLDGLNEVESQYMPQLQTDIRHLAGLLPEASFIITSRPPPPAMRLPVDKFELIPLDDCQVKELLFRDANVNQARLWDGLFCSCRELLRNPFYATVAGELLKRQETLPLVPAQMLSQFTAQRVSELRSVQISKTAASDFLGRLGYSITLLGKAAFTEDYALKIAHRSTSASLNTVCCAERLDAFVSAGLLQRRSSTFSFTHQIVQQYYAALHLCRQYEKGTDIISVLEQQSMHGSYTTYTTYYVWEEVVPLICDLCEDPDEFIRLLLRRVPLLSAISVGNSYNRSDNTVKTVVDYFAKSLNNSAIFALGATRSSEALPALLECFKFKEKERRLPSCGGGDFRTPFDCSVPALFDLPRDDVNAAVQELTKDKDPIIRHRAADFLRLLNKPKSLWTEPLEKQVSRSISDLDVSSIKHQIKADISENDALEVVGQLEHVSDPQCEDLLILLLSHPSRYVRRAAAKSLGELGCKKAIREIAHIYTWTEHNGGKCAGQGWYWLDLLIAIDMIGTPASANALVELLSHPEYEHSSMTYGLLFDVLVKYADTVTLHKLEEHDFLEDLHTFVQELAARVRFLLSLA